MDADALLSLDTTARQIAEEEPYRQLLDDLERRAGEPKPSHDELRALLAADPGLLREYRRINRELGRSSIHLAELAARPDDSAECLGLKRRINDGADRLRAIERFSAPASGSVVGIWVGSAVVLLVFCVHNVLAIYTDLYESAGRVVYGAYLALVGLGVAAHWLVVRRHDDGHARFRDLHRRTCEAVDEAVERGCFRREDSLGD